MPAASGPFRGGKVHVCAERCGTCIFRPGNLMRLGPGRLRGVLDGNLGIDSALTCHETLEEWPGDKLPAVCRGFYDHPRAAESLPMRLAHADESAWVVFDS